MWIKWLQVVGYLLSVLGTCLSVITTLLPDWKHTGDETEVKFQGRVHARGLWLTCDLGPLEGQFVTGLSRFLLTRTSAHCPAYYGFILLLGACVIVLYQNCFRCEAISVSFFRLESEVQAGRILTLLSISAGGLALTLAPFGLACTNLQKQGCVKRVIIWISAALMMLSGMFVGIAVSIFAKQTSDDYWESIKTQSKFPLLESRGRFVFVYGRSLYTGWLAMTISLFSSICFFFGDAHLCAADRLITPKKEIGSTTTSSKANKQQQQQLQYHQTQQNGGQHFPPPPPEIFNQNGIPTKINISDYEKSSPTVPHRASVPPMFPPGRMMVVNTKTGEMRPVELDPSRITSWGINGGSVDPKILEKALGETTTNSPEGEVSRVSPQREAPPPPTPMVKSQKKEKEKSPKMEKLEKKISRISMKLKPKGTAAPITVTALSANSPTNAEKSRNKPQTITNL